MRYLKLFLDLLMVITNKIFSVTTFDQYRICRVSKTGTEYVGEISETKSELICDFWEFEGISSNGDVTKNITDYDFPDGSRKAAKNFCRNPNGSASQPWCFTNLKLGKKEDCKVPICCFSSEECRDTGPGMEYSGEIHKTVYDNECLHWASVIKNESIDNMLPEGSIMLAGKSCRNPSGVESGPWCYVLSEESADGKFQEETWIKEPCNVPHCFSHNDIAVLHNATSGNIPQNYYTHFTSINGDTGEIKFSIKLWNPEDWQKGEIRVALSLVSIPVSGNQLRKWDIGFEVILKNIKGGVTPNTDEEESWEDIAGLMSGIRWSRLKISWNNGFITLSDVDKEKPLFLHEYKEPKNCIFCTDNTKIKFISIMGSTAFWNMTHGKMDCEEHITTSMKFTRYWLLSIETLNKYLTFHLRSWGYCSMDFRISPALEYPRIQLIMQDDTSKTIILLHLNRNETATLSSTKLPNSLSYWKWEEFSISISGYQFLMMISTKNEIETIFDVNHKIFQAVKWFAISSATTSHWTMFCKPSILEFEPVPPECSVSIRDVEYDGHQWVTKYGLPCLPWVANIMEGLKPNQFPEGSISAALNYCRNPSGDIQGTFCFAINISSSINPFKEECSLRKCKFKDCRIAGTGNDFMGHLTKTISGKECQIWSSNSPHVVRSDLLNDYLFPERSVETAKNYCRDPSQNVAGPWCYTSDKKVTKDLCHVPDCHKSTACTVITTMATKKKIYLVPKWRAEGLPLWVKMWNPNVTTALVLDFYPFQKGHRYQLILGDEDNEHIRFNFISDDGKQTLLKQKTSSHFLSSGRWLGMIIHFGNDEIRLNYEDKPSPFFSWKKGINEIYPPINAIFFSYEAKSKDDEGSLGLNFPCDVCQTEVCSREISHYSVFYPMNIWNINSSIIVDNLTFHVRGTGMFSVNLYQLPGKFPEGILKIDASTSGDLMELQYVWIKYLGRHALKHKGSPAILKDYWSEITITFSEQGSLWLNGSNFLNWTYPRPPLLYYFSVQCTEEITWVVNCQPPQIDGKPIDGGWSPWSSWDCSVSCGGGRGTRRRTCTHPTPSMFGKSCEGPNTDKGICNELACGEITSSTISLIRKHLAEQANNVKVQHNDIVTVHCNSYLLKIIQKESPKSTIHWIKNGFKISADIKVQDINPDDFNILIKSASTSDSGVYACVLIKPGEDQEVIDITALIVKSKEFTKTCRIQDKLHLKANSSILNFVYMNLRLSWYHEEELYKEYDVTDLRLIDEEIIQPVSWEHEGIWSCIVFQDQLSLNWTTSYVNVRIKQKANWATYMLEEDMFNGKLGSSEYVIYIILGILFTIVIAIATFVTIFIIRLQRYFKKVRNK